MPGTGATRRHPFDAEHGEEPPFCGADETMRGTEKAVSPPGAGRRPASLYRPLSAAIWGRSAARKRREARGRTGGGRCLEQALRRN